MGYGSRRDVQAMVRAGWVVLDGAPVLKADGRIAVSPDLPQRMLIRGEPVDPPPGMVLMLNKPLGVTCSHKDPGLLVYSLLPERWRRREPPLSTVGRLDKETSGLLLLTDDGALLHRIISPKAHVSKRYRVTLDRPLKGTEGSFFASGALMLESEEKPLAPAQLEVISEKEALLTVTEGRYHQVRRMFAAAGNHVHALHRERIGNLMLPADLAPGQYRILCLEEIARIFEAPGITSGTSS
jgi:16S rRNA pseudouridine516 synthase